MIRQWLVTSAICACASAQTTTRASVDSNGAQADNGGGKPAISADGRYVAFVSGATNLVPGDTNGYDDVFVRDMIMGTTMRVSVDSNGVQANELSLAASISADGRYVVFCSVANNLVPGDTNNVDDVFLHDRWTGTTTRVSVDSNGVQGNGNSGLFGLSISADGRYVAFQSSASNLVTGDTNTFDDVFVHDTLTGITLRVSVNSAGVQGNFVSSLASISSDGRFIAFSSGATNLVAGDTNGVGDVFVHNLVLGTTTRVSVDSSGAQGNGGSGLPSISANGRYVAFNSGANNLVPGDTNNFSDVFVHDMLTGTTTRVSLDSSGVQGNADSGLHGLSISADGRYVAFASYAVNLVTGDTNGFEADIFLHDMVNGRTTLLSLDSSGTQGNNSSADASVSLDGRYVAFTSYATNLVTGDTNGAGDVFLRDRGVASAFVSLCFGDGTGGTCPCSNTGNSNHGCENSAATGGALLSGSGIASLSSDSVQLTAANEVPTALSIVLQGNSIIVPTNFGDGLRCAGGSLKRLYTKHAVGGAITAPQAGDTTISARSATLGDAIPLGATRAYQVYYRDPNLMFCPGGFNVSSAIAIAWGA